MKSSLRGGNVGTLSSTYNNNTPKSTGYKQPSQEEIHKDMKTSFLLNLFPKPQNMQCKIERRTKQQCYLVTNIIPLNLPLRHNQRTQSPIIFWSPSPPIHTHHGHSLTRSPRLRSHWSHCRELIRSRCRARRWLCIIWLLIIAIWTRGSGVVFWGWGIDVFTIYVLGFGYECASAVTAAGVAFFESVELVFLLEEVEEMHVCDVPLKFVIEEWELRIEIGVVEVFER